MYAQLGNIRFEGMYGFDAFTRRREMQYAKHELIDGKPRLQRTGPALDAITVGIRLNSQYVDPEANIRRLEEAQQAEEALTLILGNGAVVGDFVIEAINETTEKTDDEGNLVSARIELSLLESFDPDRERTEQTAAEDTAFSLARHNPPTYTLSPPIQPPTAATVELTAAGAEAGQIGDVVGRLEQEESARARLFRKISEGVDRMQDGLERYRSLILRGMSEYRNAQEIVDSVDETVATLGNLRAAADLENVTTALEANRSMQSAMQQTDNTSTAFIAQVATRRL